MQQITASFTAWQVGMILDGMFQGQKSKWPGFDKWVEGLGLMGEIRRTTPQDVSMESARIKSKFEKISADILKQRAQGEV